VGGGREKGTGRPAVRPPFKSASYLVVSEEGSRIQFPEQ
jgi:hypothetical protein